MKWLSIVLVALLVVAVGVALWMMVLPRRCYALLSDTDRGRLEAMLPAGADMSAQVETYTDFASMYDRMMADIAASRHHVHMQFMKFEDDATSRCIGDALAGRAAAGVEARLLCDDFMCRRWRRYYRELRGRGVEVAGFRPLHLPFIHKVDYYRNHRKAVVIDGRVAYVGGINIADRYLHGLAWGCWRDTMIRIEGPAARAVQQVFAADWRYAGGRLLTEPVYHAAVPLAAVPPPDGGHPSHTVSDVAVIASGPIGDGPTIMHYTADLLRGAQSYVWFESPYFIPPAELRRELLAAARRGVDVRVLVPPRGDRGEGTQWGSKSYFSEAMEAGVRIAHYQPGYMHSKIIVADDSTAVVGSCNIDYRSYLLCEEMAAVIHDGDYVASLKEVFLADEAQSRYVDPEAWPHRPLADKVRESLFRMVATQL